MIDKIKSQDDTSNLFLITNGDTMLEYSELIDDVVKSSKGDLSVRITKTVPDDIWTEVNAQQNNQHPFWTHREATKHWR